MSFLNLFIAVLVTLTFSLNINATASIGTLQNTTTVIEKVEGGPRTIIQNMTEVVIEQPTNTTLYITIVNSADNSIIEMEATSEKEVMFSTEEWDVGTYKIETTDNQAEYQEFYITVE
jgi:hypothetical protein